MDLTIIFNLRSFVHISPRGSQTRRGESELENEALSIVPFVPFHGAPSEFPALLPSVASCLHFRAPCLCYFISELQHPLICWLTCKAWVLFELVALSLFNGFSVVLGCTTSMETTCFHPGAKNIEQREVISSLWANSNFLMTIFVSGYKTGLVLLISRISHTYLFFMSKAVLMHLRFYTT
jgi:hypothetical protein